MRMKLKKWSKPFLVEHPEVYIAPERYNDASFIALSKPTKSLFRNRAR